MLGAAACLAACLLLAALAPARLARATWPALAPSYALVLWQALGLATGLLAVEVALAVGLAPAGGTPGTAGSALLAGGPAAVGALPWWSLLALTVAAAVLLRLLTVLVSSAAGTVRARHRHRVLVDLVATRNPLLAGTRIVDHDLPLAYCLPGLRPRVVLSRGVLDLLREDEVRAVLAHETAHVEQRHDLVVLPFVALGVTFPSLPAVRIARQQVALLIEMLADDRAVRTHPPEVLARALCKVGAATVPGGGLGVAVCSDDVQRRASRLLAPTVRLHPAARGGVLAASAALLLLPVLGLLLPGLLGPPG